MEYFFNVSQSRSLSGINRLTEPTTADASSEIAAGVFFISTKDVANNQMIATHANSASTTRIFNYVLVG